MVCHLFRKQGGPQGSGFDSYTFRKSGRKPVADGMLWEHADGGSSPLAPTTPDALWWYPATIAAQVLDPRGSVLGILEDEAAVARQPVANRTARKGAVRLRRLPPVRELRVRVPPAPDETRFATGISLL